MLITGLEMLIHTASKISHHTRSGYLLYSLATAFYKEERNSQEG